MNNQYSPHYHNVPNSQINPDFNTEEVLEALRHYLPSQSALKDFVHHNTLHAYQDIPFFEATRLVSSTFGYEVSYSIQEFRQLYKVGKIRSDILEDRIMKKKGRENIAHWKKIMCSRLISEKHFPTMGKLRSQWKDKYKVDMNNLVHPLLFRCLCNYLDQGISLWPFPGSNLGFLASLRKLEENGWISLFKSQRARAWFKDPACTLEKLLEVLVGEKAFFRKYLFDQQFAHPGWSGMVAVLEKDSSSFMSRREISLHEVIFLELLLELDVLDQHHKNKWRPIAEGKQVGDATLFNLPIISETDEILQLWQEAFEWSSFDPLLAGIRLKEDNGERNRKIAFQAMFCIDDRSSSIRQYLEKLAPTCETFGTPGFFGVEFYYRPGESNHHSKLCPATVTPNYLVREHTPARSRAQSGYFKSLSKTILNAWIVNHALGFLAAFRLLFNIFRPSKMPGVSSSLDYSDPQAELDIKNQGTELEMGNLQTGYTKDEMCNRAEGLLKSIGLTSQFSEIVYVVGHGSTSVNNPHFAAYDCGACSGRPGVVNARVICAMLNFPDVRLELKKRSIDIPEETIFIGGLHDTTRDEMIFYLDAPFSETQSKFHRENLNVFDEALLQNARERSRRFLSIDSSRDAKKILQEVRQRSVSIFEPRPELNHATNAYCIVGRRSLTKHLFLDRRAFLNSYDYSHDPVGKILLEILKPAVVVCGGINLEYYFSRVDPENFGAGTKLPHNVMGLFAVANGTDGDLRTGLPTQMTEMHDHLRLLMVVEHFPEVVMSTIKRHEPTYLWFLNEWMHLAVVHPETQEIFYLTKNGLEPYLPVTKEIGNFKDELEMFASESDNLPVFNMKNGLPK